jgi:hypothetical protein
MEDRKRPTKDERERFLKGVRPDLVNIAEAQEMPAHLQPRVVKAQDLDGDVFLIANPLHWAYYEDVSGERFYKVPRSKMIAPYSRSAAVQIYSELI